MVSRESMSWIGVDVAEVCVRAVRVLCVFVTAGLFLMFAPVAGATVTSLTWTGDAAESSWSAAKNWEGETAPSSPGPVALDFPRLPSCSGACYKSTNDMSGLDVESIGIDDGDEYELTGDTITLGDGGLTASPAGGRAVLPVISLACRSNWMPHRRGLLPVAAGVASAKTECSWKVI